MLPQRLCRARRRTFVGAAAADMEQSAIGQGAQLTARGVRPFALSLVVCLTHTLDVLFCLSIYR